MSRFHRRRSCAVYPPAPVTASQTLLIWVAVTLGWNASLTYFLDGVQNGIYIQWGGIAFTMIILTKYFTKRENLRLTKFFGNKLSFSSILELSAVLAICVLFGIVCWALMVMLSGKIDVGWACKYWNLVTRSEFQEIKWRPSWLVLETICGVILVPITEEIVFRGFVLRRLGERYCLRTAIILSSLLFAVFHLDQSFIGSFVHGVIFALLAARFASLYAPMIVHGAYNAVVILLQRGFGVTMVVDANRIDSTTYWLPELALFFACSLALMVYFRFCLHNIHSVCSKV